MDEPLNAPGAENDALHAEVDRLRAAAAQLTQAEAKFRGLLESAPDAMVIVDTTGHIAMVNAQTEALFGYAREDLVGQPIELLIPSALADRHRHHRIRYTAEPHTRPMGAGIDLVARRRDGSEFPTEISLSPLRTDDEMLITAVVRDITERKRAIEEQQLRLAARVSAAEAAMLQSARLAAVGQLAASIAHEINNPLYAARNALYLVSEDLPESMRDHPYMAMAQEQLARIAGIIERMRDFYRPTRGELAPTDLNVLIEETLAVAGLNVRHSRITIAFTPTIDLPPVLGNPDQFRQVFLNLILNAIDAMPHGGALGVRTSATGDARAGGWVVAEVADSGIGMATDIRERIFEPFFTNKPSGTGLGLPISAHIITQHGGHIEVDSVEGAGTTFRIFVPIPMI